MPKLTFKYFLFLGLLCLITAKFSFATPVNQQLKIGVIAPLTGGVAIWGESVSNAIRIANGESQEPATLLFEDEENCSATKALSAYRSLTATQNIDILIASCLDGAQAVAPLAARDKLPLIISGRSSKDFQKRNPNALSWLSLLDYEGEAIADLITEKQWQRGAAMVWNGYFGVQFAESIKTAVTSKKLAFEFEVLEVSGTSNPVGAEVQRLLRNQPEVIFLMLSEPAAAFVVKQLRALRYQGDIIIQSSMLQTYDPEVRRSFLGTLQQKFIVNESKFSELQDIIGAQQGETVADDFVFSYDGFKDLLASANECKKQQPVNFDLCLQKTMRNESWREGVSGKYRFMPDGSTERPMTFKEITETGLK